MNVGMFENMWILVSGNAPSVLFRRMFLFTREWSGLNINSGSECASGLACIFVVKVEGALQFLCGGKLFSIFTHCL